MEKINAESTIFISDSELAQRELEQCVAVMQRARRGIVFSSLSAWKIYGFPVPRQLLLDDCCVHACVSDQRHRSQLQGVRFQVWNHPLNIRTVQHGEYSVTVVEPFTACMQMLSYCSREEAVVMFDALICRNPHMRVLTPDELAERVRGLGSFHGCKIGRWALRYCREGVDSPMETRLRIGMVLSGLPCPEVNYRVVHRDTAETWFLDLAYPRLGIAFEYQGEQYHATREGLQRDSRKLTALQGLGWRVMTVTADMLRTAVAWTMLLDTVYDVMRQQSRLRRVRLRLNKRSPVSR